MYCRSILQFGFAMVYFFGNLLLRCSVRPMGLFVMGHCGASAQCEETDKTHVLLEVELGYDSEIYLAGQKSTKRNVYPLHFLKKMNSFNIASIDIASFQHL